MASDGFQNRRYKIKRCYECQLIGAQKRRGLICGVHWPKLWRGSRKCMVRGHYGATNVFCMYVGLLASATLLGRNRHAIVSRVDPGNTHTFSSFEHATSSTPPMIVISVPAYHP